MKNKPIFTITASVIAVSAAVAAGVHIYAEKKDEANFAETAPEISDTQTAFEMTELDPDKKIEAAVNSETPENIIVSEEKGVISEVDDLLSEKTADSDTDVFSSVDFVDDRISYTVTIDNGKISYEKINLVPYKYEEESSEIASEHLKDFLETDNFPVDKAYEDNLTRLINCGIFVCDVLAGTIAVSPVEGNVIAVDYAPDLGQHIALEFSTDKVLILAHFDEITVKPGDSVTVGQALGTCGVTGTVDRPRLSMIAMKK